MFRFFLFIFGPFIWSFMFSAMKQVKQLRISGFRVFAQDGSLEKNIHLKRYSNNLRIETDNFVAGNINY